MPARAFVIASERDVGRGVFVTLSACYGRRCDSREQADDVVFDGVLFVEHKLSSNDKFIQKFPFQFHCIFDMFIYRRMSFQLARISCTTSS